jgi:hypothetical protein
VAKLIPVKTLRREDFQAQADWIGRLLQPLNEFMSAVQTALNRDLTVADNLRAQIAEVSITENQTYPLGIKLTLPNGALGLAVLRAYEKNNPSNTIGSAVWADWEALKGEVRLNGLTGLSASKSYKVVLLIFGA